MGEIATQRGVAIETPALRTLITTALEEGWWAKSSGAGGGDCGIALAAPGVNPRALHERWTAAGIRPLNLHVSPMGADTAPHDTPTEGDGK
nr:MULTISPECIES: hypothetical protein [Corynebacterium]